MNLFQKSIPVVLLIALLGAGFGKVAAQPAFFSAYFHKDSIAAFALPSTTGGTLNLTDAQRLSCFIFLSPDCPLCKNYAPLINKLQQQYRSDISFYLVVPGASYTVAEIKTFSKAYLKKAPLYIDKTLGVSHYLRATVTPEVLLLESSSGKAVYSGALDNWAVSLGKQRLKATENYLLDAIESYLHNQPPPVAYKEPVGCFINDF